MITVSPKRIKISFLLAVVSLVLTTYFNESCSMGWSEYFGLKEYNPSYLRQFGEASGAVKTPNTFRQDVTQTLLSPKFILASGTMAYALKYKSLYNNYTRVRDHYNEIKKIVLNARTPRGIKSSIRPLVTLIKTANRQLEEDPLDLEQFKKDLQDDSSSLDSIFNNVLTPAHQKRITDLQTDLGRVLRFVTNHSTELKQKDEKTRQELAGRSHLQKMQEQLKQLAEQIQQLQQHQQLSAEQQFQQQQWLQQYYELQNALQQQQGQKLLPSSKQGLLGYQEEEEEEEYPVTIHTTPPSSEPRAPREQQQQEGSFTKLLKQKVKETALSLVAPQ